MQILTRSAHSIYALPVRAAALSIIRYKSTFDFRLEYPGQLVAGTSAEPTLLSAVNREPSSIYTTTRPCELFPQSLLMRIARRVQRPRTDIGRPRYR